MTQKFRLMRFSYCPKVLQTFTDKFPEWDRERRWRSGVPPVLPFRLL